MKSTLKIIILVAILSLVLNTVSIAQESTVASGNDATGSGGSISYSIGQVCYSANAGTTGSITQGVQQPYEISVSGIENPDPAFEIACSVYPNPTSEYLILEIKDMSTTGLTYQLYDNLGKQIDTRKVESNKCQIRMQDYHPAVYYLRVYNNQGLVKSFKIVKY